VPPLYNKPISLAFKALYQFIADSGVTVTKLEEIVNRKVEEVVERVLNRMLEQERLQKLLLAAVGQVLVGEKKCFDSYGWHNRIRDLIQQELQRTVLAEYTVKVEKKT
jgi:hypothetical protein